MQDRSSTHSGKEQPQATARADAPHKDLPVNSRIRKPITSAELAKVVGVSRSTVSMVMGGRGDKYKISKKTQDLVNQAASEHGYQQAPSGVALRRGSSGMISVILPDFRENWAEEIMRGVHAAFEGTSLIPFVTTHNFSTKLLEKDLIAAVTRRDTAAIVFPLPGLTSSYRAMAKEGVFVVLLGDCPVDGDDLPYVAWDSESAARNVVEHLVETGRRRIAHLSFDYPLKQSQGRFLAYQETLRKYDLPVEDHWVYKPPVNKKTAEETAQAADQFFSPGRQPPDAIFCLNDGLALPLLEALHDRGIRVPEDVAVAGMGDVPLSRHGKIGLTTVREPRTQMGEAAGEFVLAATVSKADKRNTIGHKIISSNEVLVRPTTVGWNHAGGDSR